MALGFGGTTQAGGSGINVANQESQKTLENTIEINKENGAANRQLAKDTNEMEWRAKAEKFLLTQQKLDNQLTKMKVDNAGQVI